jgi:hypothetical protein
MGLNLLNKKPKRALCGTIPIPRFHILEHTTHKSKTKVLDSSKLGSLSDHHHSEQSQAENTRGGRNDDTPLRVRSHFGHELAKTTEGFAGNWVPVLDRRAGNLIMLAQLNEGLLVLQ